MSIEHKNIDKGNLHVPKGFEDANNSTVVRKNASGNLEWISETLIEGPPGPPGPAGTLPTFIVTDLASPDSVLNTLGLSSGKNIIANQEPAGTADLKTEYIYDLDGPSVNSPWVVSTTDGGTTRWIATGGRYTNQQLTRDNGDTLYPSADSIKLAGVESGAEVNPDVVPQAEAEAGTATTERIWTAERVKQSIEALSGAGSVIGPGSSVNGASTVFDGTTGNLIKENSKVTHDTTSGKVTQTQFNPVFVNSLEDNFNLAGCIDVSVVGNLGYVVSENGDTLTVVDFSENTTPIILGVLTHNDVIGSFTAVMDKPQAVEVVGNFAYIVSQTSTSLQIVDVSDPKNPKPLGSVVDATAFNAATALKVSGSFAFLTARDNNSFSIVDISDPENPFIVDTHQDNVRLSAVRGLDVVGNIIVIAGNGADTVAMYSFDPLNPLGSITLLGDITDAVNLDQPRFINITDTRAYLVCTGDSSLVILDITDPANITILGRTNDGILSPRKCLKLGDYVYVSSANNNSIVVVDIRDETTPVKVGSIVDAANLLSVRKFTIVGDKLFACARTGNRITRLDIGGHKFPAASIGSLQAESINVSQEVVVGRRLIVKDYIGVGKGGISTQGLIFSKGNSVSILPKNTVQVEDIPATIDNTTEYVLLDQITSPSVFTFAASANNKISSSNPATNFLALSSTGTIFNGSSIVDLIIDSLQIFSTGPGILFDLTGSGFGTIFNLLGRNIFHDFASLGTITSLPTSFKDVFFIDNSGGLKLRDLTFGANGIVYSNTIDSNSTFFDISNTTADSVTVTNNFLNTHPGETVFFIHSNLNSNARVIIRGNNSNFFLGKYFGSETGSVTTLADSATSPGVKTTVSAANHNALDGDIVVLSGFVTQTQYNTSFVASNIIPNVSFDVVEVFTATDTGTWTNNSLDETDRRIRVIDNVGQKDSAAIGQALLNIQETTTVLPIGSGTITAVADNGTGGSTITDVAHGLSEDDVLEITGTAQYNGTYIIFNVTTNTFDIAVPFIGSETGAWRQDNDVLIPVEGSNWFVGEATERFTVSTTGVLTYIGLETITTLIIYHATIQAGAGTDVLDCGLFINRVKRDSTISSTSVSVGDPQVCAGQDIFTIKTGDTLRFGIANQSDNSSPITDRCNIIVNKA